MTDLRYCKVCGLPEAYSGIHIHSNGVCNFCEFFYAHKDVLENKEERLKLFREETERGRETAKERNAPYDCIVGLSGGKDSTYIISQMVKEYQMRVLAVTVQNGFHTEYGRKNIENALEKLNVDHITVHMREELLRKQYTMCLKMMKNICGVCFHNIHYFCHEIAGRYGIPLVVNGRTKGQIYQSADQVRGIEPFEISRDLQAFEYQMFGQLPELMEKQGKVNYLKEFPVTSLSFFAYHDIAEEEMIRFLEKELGWVKPETGIPHADCWAHPIAETLHLQKFGYPIRTGELAVQVRYGERTIREAEKERQSDAEAYREMNPELMERLQKRIQGKASRKGRGQI